MSKIWNKDHYNVQTIDYQPFTKCDQCEDYQKVKNTMKTEYDRQQLQAQYEDHHYKVR
jgi:hypothetical protein